MTNVKSIFDKTEFDMKISEIMTKQVISITPQTSAEVCAKLMIEHSIGSVVVVDEDGVTIGIITKENLIRHVIAKKAIAEQIKASEIMSYPVITIDKKLTLTEAMEKMFKKSIRHLVITDSDGKVKGICTDTDIFKVVPQLIFLEQEYIKLIRERDVVENDKENTNKFAGYCDDCRVYSDELIYIDGIYACPTCSVEQ